MAATDLLFNHPGSQSLGVSQQVPVGQAQSGAGPQGREDIAQQGIVTQAGERREAIGTGQFKPVGLPVQKTAERPQLAQHGARAPAGSGGKREAGQIVGGGGIFPDPAPVPEKGRDDCGPTNS